MKYIVCIPDGVADSLQDYPTGDTPMRMAHTPTLDALADHGVVGWAKTVPDACSPGSDVACLSIFGYDPEVYYTGRSPLEAVSMGIDLGDNLAFRCNLVTVEDGVMKDFTAGHISTEEADQIIQALNAELRSPSIRFYTGVQYRHALVTPADWQDCTCTPPHDIQEQLVLPSLPQGPAAVLVLDLMNRSKMILANHPVNLARRKTGKRPVTQIWLWGQGTSPKLPLYSERCGLRGAAISAVDLIKGIAMLAGLNVIEVKGATGLPDTNYEGKADAALTALEHGDFVCVHVEATDEMGHKGDEKMKTQAFTDFDQRLVRHIVEGLRAKNEPFRMLVMPDHPTPIRIRTHSKDPVPFLLYDSRYPEQTGSGGYNEWNVKQRSQSIILGYKMIDLLCEKIVDSIGS